MFVSNIRKKSGIDNVLTLHILQAPNLIKSKYILRFLKINL